MSTASGEPSKKLTWVKKMEAKIKPIASSEPANSNSGSKRKKPAPKTEAKA